MARNQGPDPAPEGELPGASQPTNTDHTDIDSTTGDSVGTHADGADDAGQRNAPPEAATPDDAQEGAQEARETPPDPRGDAMAQIIANRSQQLTDELTEARASEPEQMAELDRQAGVTTDEAGSTDDTAQTDDEAASGAGDGTDAAAQAAQAADDLIASMREHGIDPDKAFDYMLRNRKESLSVYGEEQETSLEDVIAAGRATLQKERAGDHRIAQAQAYEDQLKEYHARLDKARDNYLKGLDPDGQPLTHPQGRSETQQGNGALPDGATPPTQQSNPVDYKAKMQDALKTLYDEGDYAKAAEMMAETFSQAQGRGDTIPPSAETIAAQVADLVEQRQTEKAEADAKAKFEDDRKAANKLFADEFSDVLNDDDLFVIAKNRIETLKQLPDWQGKPMTEMVREVGKYVQGKYLKAGDGQQTNQNAQQQQNATADELAHRRTLKGKTPVPPSTAQTMRHEDPKPAQVDNSASGFVEQLRRQRRPDQYAQR